MKKLTEILPQVLAKYRLTASARSVRVIEEFRKFFVVVYGEEALGELGALCFKNAKLQVEIKSATRAHRLFLQKAAFIAHIRKALPETKITDLVTKVAREAIS